MTRFQRFLKRIAKNWYAMLYGDDEYRGDSWISQACFADELNKLRSDFEEMEIKYNAAEVIATDITYIISY